MELRIVSSAREKKFMVKWIELYTPVGNFVIHSGHAPTLLSLLPDHDIEFQLTTGQRESIKAANGVAEITREVVTIILSE